ncbi:MAG: hypothetical protein K6B13_02120 [Prevotella sp.]|nr:hypothetical protein [Prevotella sp.]
MKDIDIVAVRDVLASLDTAHGELVHGTLLLRYIRPELFGQAEQRMVKKYWKLCISFFRLSRTLLPQIADYTCVLLTRMCEDEMALTGKHQRYDEAERVIWRQATKRIRVANKLPMTAHLNSKYSQCLPTNDLKETMQDIAPVLQQTVFYVNKKAFYWAIGNLTVLFRVLHKISKWHPEWYRGSVSDGSYDLRTIHQLARGLYCKLRAAEGLHAAVAEEMDANAVVMNARYDKMFGDWNEHGFTDMVNGCGQQSQDYSQVETWPVFAQILQE